MSVYLFRRLMAAIPVIAGVIAVVFILTSVVPGDPVRLMMGQRGDPETMERIREELGLNRPLWWQFVDFFVKAVTLDFGKSYSNNMPVMECILSRIPLTAGIALWSVTIAAIMGIGLGIISALNRHSILDYGSMFVALLGISAPGFWIGLLLVLLFQVKLGWVPGTGMGDGSWIYLVLPVTTLSIRPTALIARLTRSSILEILGQDYIRTARAKGLAEKIVVLKHALKNAMIPVVTVTGIEMASFLSGAIVIETLFSLPGLGRLTIEAISSRDFPVIRGVVFFIAVVFVLINLIVDLSYSLLDPRIRYDEK